MSSNDNFNYTYSSVTYPPATYPPATYPTTDSTLYPTYATYSNPAEPSNSTNKTTRLAKFDSLIRKHEINPDYAIKLRQLVGFEIVISTLEFASLSPRSRNTSPNEEPPKGSIAWPFGGNCFIVSSLSLGLELTG